VARKGGKFERKIGRAASTIQKNQWNPRSEKRKRREMREKVEDGGA
jgi:hypothetical protein